MIPRLCRKRATQFLLLAAVACADVNAGVPIDWTFTTFNRRMWHGYCSMTPPLARDSVVYVGGGYAWNNRTTLYALDARTGRAIWETRLGPIFTANMLAADANHVYAAAGDTLRAFDRTTGAVVWTFANTRRQVAADDSSVYVNSYNEEIVALVGATGAVRWRRALPERAEVMVVSGEAVYAAAGAKLYAIAAASGELREVATRVRPAAWVWAVDSTLIVTTRAVDSSWLAVRWDPRTDAVDTLGGQFAGMDGDAIVIAARDETFALDPRTLQRRWTSRAIPTADQGESAFANGVMYQANLSGQSRVADAIDIQTGAKRWALETGDIVEAVRHSRGHLIVVSDDCRVYAVKIN